jgi:glycosyltransferase involved in cell wall biosynthesis
MKVDQIIVVDDGSTDDSADVVRKFGHDIRYLYKTHTGITKTLNDGVEQADGSYLTFLDADDLWKPEKTEIQFNFLQDRADLDALFTLTQEFMSPDLSESECVGLNARPLPLRGMHKVSAMFRKSFFDQVGGFNEDHNTGEFIEWYGRAVEIGMKYVLLEEVLTLRRVHLTNHTRTQRADLQQFTSILKKALDRKRAGI